MSVMILNESIAIVAARDGYLVINRHDRYIGKAIEIYGEYIGAEADFLASLVFEGDTVIEVGANIGAHTVGLAKAVGAHGKVFAYEPQRACHALLQSQIALNQLQNVYAFNEGAGAQASTLIVPPQNYQKTGNFGGVSLKSGGDGDTVQVVPLDQRHADIPVHLIKIDVEGMEYEVLLGARKLIDECHPILYVENDREEKSEALLTLIFDMGYRCWWHFPNMYNPQNFFGVQDNIFPNVVSANMVCVHPDAGIPPEGLEEIHSPSDWHSLKPK